MRRALALVLGFAAASVAAQATLKVPSGGHLTATLESAKTAARVQGAPRIVEFQFGRKVQGAFRAYAKNEPMAPDRPFVIRARYDAEPPFTKTEITLARGEIGLLAVAMFKMRDNPAILESEEISLGEAKACRKEYYFCNLLEWIRE